MPSLNLKFIHQLWWKLLAILLILYSLIVGFFAPVPLLPILRETIRNLYFHVPMWFTMLFLLSISVYHSVKYLNSGKTEHDLLAIAYVRTGMLFFTLGLLTGMLWGRFSWGSYWSSDPKLNGVAIVGLLYCAYLTLRNSIVEEQKKAKVTAVYNIFSFPIMIALLLVLPRMTDSLHPGNGGNPAFGTYDLDGRMRLVFYPACVGWILLGIWLTTLCYRIALVAYKTNR